MEIVGYGNNQTRKLCSDSKKAKKDLGELVAEKWFAASNFIESASSTFSHPSSSKEKHHTEETDALYRKIGKLEVENDFLKKKWNQLSGL